MIAKFFQKREVENTIVLIILLLIFYLINLFAQGKTDLSFMYLLGEIGYFCWFVLFLLVCNFIIRKNDLTFDNSYALFFVVTFFGIFYDTFFSSDILFSNLALLLAFRKMYSLRSHINLKKKLFDGGFWIGIASLFYMPSSTYLLLIFAAVLSYRRNDLKNLFMPVVGFFAPITIFFTYQHVIDNDLGFLEKMALNFEYSIDFYLEASFLVPLLVMLLFTVISVIVKTPKIWTVSNNFKGSWNVLVVHFFISIGLVLFTVEKNGGELLFLFFPSAVLMVNFIQKKESNFLKNMALYLFLGLAIWHLFYSF